MDRTRASQQAAIKELAAEHVARAKKQEESLRKELVGLAEKDIDAKVSTALNKMQAEYDERARRAKAANEVDVKIQSDAIAAAEQRHKMDKETMEAKMLEMAKKTQVEAAAAASKKASDEAIAAAKKKAETKVAAGDVAPPMDAHAWNTLGCNGGGTVSGKVYDKKACYLKALEVNDKHANSWHDLGAVGGGTVSGVLYSAAQCKEKYEVYK